ncbi:MAG: hypothetical protein O2955_11265 [Planctomycetota bacterium]|nr:hypothetical protein [Planctomycetota bacterium]MDA1213092.1 hypothetical protein [Planctomycetota bacterium]
MSDERNDDPRAAVDELMEQAYEFDYGTTQIALIEEAVRMADLSGDTELAFGIRQELIDAATMGGRPDLALVSFTWCLAQYDKNPIAFNTHNMLWKYKWILASLAEFPQLTREQIDAAANDMENRTVNEGFTRHAVETMRWKLAMDLGDHEEMQLAYERMRKTRRDSLSDCKACVQNCAAEHYVLLGKPKFALRAADPIIGGRMSCSEIPELTYGTILRPLFQLDRLDDAMAMYVKGYKLVAKNPEFIDTVAEHMQFLVMTDNDSKALQLISKHLPVALATPSLLKRMKFIFATVQAFLSFESKRKDSVKLRLPPKTPFTRADGVYPVGELRQEFAAAARELATAFDARNGNSYYVDYLVKLPESLAHIKPLPVPTQKRKSTENDEE